MRKLYAALATLAVSTTAMPASAAVFGDVELPEGAVSFADAVVSYTPGTGGLTAPHMNPQNAIGIPDYIGTSVLCSSAETCPYVSLGSGGSIVLQFLDNVLTGSGTSDFDLWIFEIGPDVESTFVGVSVDGLDWRDVGSVGGATSGVDLDQFGYGLDSEFRYVMLTDNPNSGSTSGQTVGADIDAVAAISTRRVDPPIGAVPEPATWALMLVGFGAVGASLRFRRRTRLNLAYA